MLAQVGRGTGSCLRLKPLLLYSGTSRTRFISFHVFWIFGTGEANLRAGRITRSGYEKCNENLTSQSVSHYTPHTNNPSSLVFFLVYLLLHETRHKEHTSSSDGRRGTKGHGRVSLASWGVCVFECGEHVGVVEGSSITMWRHVTLGRLA